jgi:hypothetical protein
MRLPNPRIVLARSSRKNSLNEHATENGKGNRLEGEHLVPSDLKFCRLVSLFRQFIRTVSIGTPSG